MNSDPGAPHKAVLERADEITNKWSSPQSVREISVELSKALLSHIKIPTRQCHPIMPLGAVDAVYGADPKVRGRSVQEGLELVIVTPGKLRGIYNLEDLVEELVLNHAWRARTQKKPKKVEVRTFPFILGVLSVLSWRNDLGTEFAQVCQAGRDEAVQLAAAAAYFADELKLADIQKGMAVGRKLEDKFHSFFSQHVACMKRAYREMRGAKVGKITKSALRARTREILKSKGVKPWGDNRKDDWTDIYREAAVEKLNQNRTGSSKSRHRDG